MICSKRQIQILMARFPFYSLLIYLSAIYSCCSPKYSPNINETGGTESPSRSQVMILVLIEDQGYSFELNQTTNKETSAFYYLENKIWAKLGIARVGLIQKDLSRITEIPFRDEDYKKDGLAPEQNCVYALRYGNPQAPFIALLRIDYIWPTALRLLCYKVAHE